MSISFNINQNQNQNSQSSVSNPIHSEKNISDSLYSIEDVRPEGLLQRRLLDIANQKLPVANQLKNEGNRSEIKLKPIQRVIDPENAIGASRNRNLAAAFKTFMAAMSSQRGEVAEYLKYASGGDHNLRFTVREPRLGEDNGGELHGVTNIVFGGSSKDIVQHMFDGNIDPTEKADDIIQTVDFDRIALNGVDVLIELVIRPNDSETIILETLNHEFGVHAIKWKNFIETVGNGNKAEIQQALKSRLQTMPQDHVEFSKGQSTVYNSLRESSMKHMQEEDSSMGGISLGMSRSQALEQESYTAMSGHRSSADIAVDFSELQSRSGQLEDALLPKFKPKPKKKGICSCCYITSACVSYKGLSDDCYQLTTLRDFRDRYVKTRDDGTEWVALYYASAPGIVTRINKQLNVDDIYKQLFNVVEHCVRLIESGDDHSAFQVYAGMMLHLNNYLFAEQPIKMPDNILETLNKQIHKNSVEYDTQISRAVADLIRSVCWIDEEEEYFTYLAYSEISN